MSPTAQTYADWVAAMNDEPVPETPVTLLLDQWKAERKDREWQVLEDFTSYHVVISLKQGEEVLQMRIPRAELYYEPSPQHFLLSSISELIKSMRERCP